jgi:uncharacterized protein YggL (DUF469 family)
MQVYGNYNHEEYKKNGKTNLKNYNVMVKFDQYSDGTVAKHNIIFLEEMSYNEKVKAAKEALDIDLEDYRDAMYSGMRNGQYFCTYRKIESEKLKANEEEIINKKLASLPYNCRLVYDSLFDYWYIAHKDLCGPAGSWKSGFNEIKISIRKKFKILEGFDSYNCRKIKVTNDFIKKLLKRK